MNYGIIIRRRIMNGNQVDTVPFGQFMADEKPDLLVPR
jgi:hypothetical protein